ncbi:MAG: hypothetical protein KF745_07315 [Phycisphaeraceae bacterium]|nr:hypothetical protein [Phycisphaeraceae bacterium]
MIQRCSRVRAASLAVIGLALTVAGHAGCASSGQQAPPGASQLTGFDAAAMQYLKANQEVRGALKSVAGQLEHMDDLSATIYQINQAVRYEQMAWSRLNVAYAESPGVTEPRYDSLQDMHIAFDRAARSMQSMVNSRGFGQNIRALSNADALRASLNAMDAAADDYMRQWNSGR